MIVGGLVLALDLVFLASLWRVPGGLEFHALDVGQGDALLLVTPEQHHVLVDGGMGHSVLLELADVLPYSFRKIDLMILTHPHADHMEGLIPVLQRFEVGAVLMSAPDYGSSIYAAFLEELGEVPVWIAQADQDFQLGSVYLDVLYPFEGILGEEMDNINNASPVIRVEWEDVSILLTGDAEQEVEAELLAAGVNLEADILKAGHHGSRTSSTLSFLEAVDPEWMVICSGEGNSFGHPHPETLEKASDLGIELLRTDQGRVSIRFRQDWRSIFAPSWRSFSSSRS